MKASEISTLTLLGSTKARVSLFTENGREMSIELSMRDTKALIDDLMASLGDLMREREKYVGLLERDIDLLNNR